MTVTYPAPRQRRELTSAIARTAEALAEGRLTGSEYAAVVRLRDKVATLLTWTPDDRS